MAYLAAVVLFPLLFWLLSGGCGLLVERLCGGRLPGLLVLPVGFATLVVVSQFTTWVSFLAPLSPVVLAVLAVVGFALGARSVKERWSARRGGWWAGPAAALATYLLVAAPEIVAGRVTFSGYLLDTTGAIQIAGAERLLHHAHAFSDGTYAYGQTLAQYFGNGYPSGAHSVLASVGWLSGQSLIWLYSVYQALELSVLALVLTHLARRAGLRPLTSAVTGTVASVPALLYAYALMGSIKEITALPALMLMAALAVDAGRLRSRLGIRAVLPFGLAAAAAFGAIGIAAAPWVGLFALAALIGAIPVNRPRDLRAWAVVGASLLVATVVLALPTFAQLHKTAKLAEGVSSSDTAAVNDPGNLLRPLKFIQAFGVWLGESHRVDPRYVNQTYVLLGIVAVCVALGIAYLLRRRLWALLGFVACSLIAWAFLHSHGTTWTDAKLLVILSPTVMFLALVGAFGLFDGRRIEALLLGAVVVAGVLASDGLLYHATNLAPTARYEELAGIGTRYAGDGPTLAPDFDEYSLYLLRQMTVDPPGVAYAGPFEFLPGATKLYGHSYDLDTLTLPTVERFATIVARRSPGQSRPPGNFRLADSGSYYTVWRRGPEAPLAHLGLGSGWQPSAVPACHSVAAIAHVAAAARKPLVYDERPVNASADLGRATHTANALPGVDLEGRTQFSFYGPARVEGYVRVPRAGRYTLWLGGSIDRPIHVYVDGRLIGSPEQQSGGDGTTIDVAAVQLAAGRHHWQLTRGGGDLRPDDALSTAIDGFVLEPQGAAPGRLGSVAPAAWRTLCGRPLDWIEAG